MAKLTFAQRVLEWFAHSGRHHLPWQVHPDAYRVWISEIMLQQTQVNTVIPYFQTFMAQYPNVAALAKAPKYCTCGQASAITPVPATCIAARRSCRSSTTANSQTL